MTSMDDLIIGNGDDISESDVLRGIIIVALAIVGVFIFSALTSD